jgi:hypothetical protein
MQTHRVRMGQLKQGNAARRDTGEVEAARWLMQPDGAFKPSPLQFRPPGEKRPPVPSVRRESVPDSRKRQA